MATKMLTADQANKLQQYVKPYMMDGECCAETAIRLMKAWGQPMEGHAGDCTIYAALENGRLTDGVCTCGYGRQRWRENDVSCMFSEDRAKQIKKEAKLFRKVDKALKEAKKEQKNLLEEQKNLLAGSKITVNFKSRVPRAVRENKFIGKRKQR